MHKAWFGPGGLKLRQIRLLVALGQSGNLNRAAEALSLGQPAASRLLAEIERLAGTPVFDRHARGLSPNMYGEVLIRRARYVLTELESTAEELAALQAGLGGSVSVGAVTAPAVTAVVRAVLRFQEQNPAVRVSVDHGISGPLIERLVEGRFDFLVARVPDDIDASMLQSSPATGEEVVLLVRRDHPLAETSTLKLAQLVQFPWIMQPQGTLIRRRMDQEFRAAGLPAPRQVIDTPSVLVSLSFVTQSDAICPISLAVADIFAGSDQFVRLVPPCEMPQLLFPPVGLVWHKARTLSPAARVLSVLVDEELRRPGTA